MILAKMVDALNLPVGARIDQRVPKKMLVEHGAPTPADKRKLTDGIEEVLWLASLKPTTIGVPAFQDDVREYLEIAVLTAKLRPGANAAQIAGLVHRAIPYPVLLLATQGEGLFISVAHLRQSKVKSRATVLEDNLEAATLTADMAPNLAAAFASAMAVARQPRADLYKFYHGWLDALIALRAAQITGAFTAASSPEAAEARRSALVACVQLRAQLSSLIASAAKERQAARQVQLNLTIQRARAEYAAACAKL